MRTEDDKRDDLPEQRRTPQSQPTSSSHHSKEMDRSTPSEMVIDEDARLASGATGKYMHNAQKLTFAFWISKG